MGDQQISSSPGDNYGVGFSRGSLGAEHSAQCRGRAWWGRSHCPWAPVEPGLALEKSLDSSLRIPCGGVAIALIRPFYLVDLSSRCSPGVSKHTCAGVCKLSSQLVPAVPAESSAGRHLLRGSGVTEEPPLEVDAVNFFAVPRASPRPLQRTRVRESNHHGVSGAVNREHEPDCYWTSDACTRPSGPDNSLRPTHEQPVNASRSIAMFACRLLVNDREHEEFPVGDSGSTRGGRTLRGAEGARSAPSGFGHVCPETC
ncbi:unnamed protein product [Boreogadus saida]